MGAITRNNVLPMAEGGPVQMFGLGGIADALDKSAVKAGGEAGAVFGQRKQGEKLAVNPLTGQGMPGYEGGGFLGSLGKIGQMTGPTGGAPVSANIQQATSERDVRDSQHQALGALTGQERLLNALQAQNGLGIQNNVAGQLQGIVSGQGYNPAMAMLNQQTGQNIQNQAAMMAGQRGSGANAGLMARQAGQMGGNMQQQAVGQGAVMQANQSLNALNSLQGLGNTMAGQQIGQTNANADARMANQQMLQNSLAGVNQANVANQGNINQGNVGLANAATQYKGGLTGGILSGAGGIFGSFLAEGGEVKMADGGALTSPIVNSGPKSSFAKYLSSPSSASYNSAPIDISGPGMGAQPSLSQIAGMFKSNGSASKSRSAPAATPAAAPAANMAAGGEMEKYKPVSATAPSGGYDSEGGGDSAAGDMSTIMSILELFGAKGGLAEKGGHVEAKNPHQKAEAPGNSYANDKIPAKLSEGEIVLPREVTMSDDPIKASADFVAKVISEKKTIPTKNYADGDVVSDPDLLAASASSQPAVDPIAAAGAPAPAANVPAANAPVANAPAASAPAASAPAVSDPDLLAASTSGQPAAQPQANKAAVVEQQFHPNSYEAKMREKLAEAEDYATGKITPETYKSLFAKKDTLGKVGMLAGMMLSSMGSGLTGQANTFLAMMDKQIENDLNAQKATKENARNFITMHYDNNTKLAQAARSNQQALMEKIKGRTEAAKEGAQLERAKTKPGAASTLSDYDDKSSKIWAESQAYSSALQGVGPYLKSQYPNDPRMSELVDKVIAPAADAKANQVIQQGAVKNKAINPENMGSAINPQKYQTLMDNSQMYNPTAEDDVKALMNGDIPPTKMQHVMDVELPNVNAIRDQRNALNEANKKLMTMDFGGRSTAAKGAQYLGTIANLLSLGSADSLAKALTDDARAVFESEREALKTQLRNSGLSDADIEARLINGGDSAKSIPIKLRGNDKSYDTAEATAAPILKRSGGLSPAERSEVYFKLKKANDKKSEEKKPEVKKTEDNKESSAERRSRIR